MFVPVENTDISESTINIIESVYQPLIQSYIDFNFFDSEELFVEQYNKIKDQSWPLCQGYVDFDKLPDNIKLECKDVHMFDKDIWLKSIEQDAQDLFKVPSRINVDSTVHTFLQKHIDIIQNKSIVDFACNYGRYSFYANAYNSENVLGIDIRRENTEIAEIIKAELGLDSSKILFQNGDIHNYEQTYSLCNNRNTAFLFGIMYHVHDHANILDAIFTSGIENIVIDTFVLDKDEPLIWWKNEPTFELRAGWHNNKKNILVGFPSVSWFDLIAENYGYKQVDCHLYKSGLHTDTKKTNKAIMLYKNMSGSSIG